VDPISKEDQLLIIEAGRILYSDWDEADEEPTKPDRKVTPMPFKIN
jgi:hypothetical protein